MDSRERMNTASDDAFVGFLGIGSKKKVKKAEADVALAQSEVAEAKLKAAELQAQLEKTIQAQKQLESVNATQQSLGLKGVSETKSQASPTPSATEGAPAPAPATTPQPDMKKWILYGVIGLVVIGGIVYAMRSKANKTE